MKRFPSIASMTQYRLTINSRLINSRSSLKYFQAQTLNHVISLSGRFERDDAN